MLVAEIAVLLQRLFDDFFELERNFVIEADRSHGSLVQDGLKMDAEVSPLKGSVPVAIS